MGRWGRARGLLRSNERRVLDAGCAFGFGTARLGRTRATVGLEYDHTYISRAQREHPERWWVRGDVEALPFAPASFDAVLLLEVLEHLAHPERAVHEAHRVLRPGGALIVSVPHRGLLENWDSLNVYSRMAARRGWPELDPTERGRPQHRHFSPDDLAHLLDGFRIQQVVRTGTGLAEPLNLALLIGLRALAHRNDLYDRLKWLYYPLAVADDHLPTGPWSYQIMVRAVRNG